MVSIEKQIINKISNYKRGKIFFPTNFIKIGSSTAIRQSLKRLEEKGILIRISKGVYLYPKRHKSLGVLFPTIEEIAIAIAKRDKARIIPTGVQALNKLGLSTQVPMNVVYLTDGTPRVIKLKNGTIKFKKAPPKILTIKSETNLLIIQALKEIGKDNVDKDVIRKVKSIIKSVDKNLLNHDIKLAPSWIAEVIKEITKD